MPGAPAAPAPVAGGTEAPAGQPSPGGLDAAAVRRVWDTVLNLVKDRKRVTHARLLGSQVAALDGKRLSLSFTTPTLARQFQEGVNIEFLKEALTEVLGVELDVVCVSGGAAGAPAASPVRAEPARAPVPAPAVHDGFAPGDEAADDDEGAPVPVERGEDAALRLVEQELGGRVVGTLTD